jgi:hypothetical protein
VIVHGHMLQRTFSIKGIWANRSGLRDHQQITNQTAKGVTSFGVTKLPPLFPHHLTCHHRPQNLLQPGLVCLARTAISRRATSKLVSTLAMGNAHEPSVVTRMSRQTDRQPGGWRQAHSIKQASNGGSCEWRQNCLWGKRSTRGAAHNLRKFSIPNQLQ